MADILPECLIQKILCLLSFKEATKTTILSKSWLQAWLTLPDLKFTNDYFNIKRRNIVDGIMERYRDGKITIQKFELTSKVYSSEILPQIYKWLDVALQNGVKDLVIGGSGLKLPISKILAAKSLRELVLSDCSLEFVSFTNCNSLRKLSLTRIHLDENILQTLLNSCPLVVTFILERCSGLKKIELLNHQNIKLLSIKTKGKPKQLVKIQIPTLEHFSYYGLRKEELDIVECQNLKSLDISYVRISDGFLRNFISRSQSLNVLKIQNCEGIPEIDSSNLVSLEYEGYEIPQLNANDESVKAIKALEISF